MSAFVVNNCPPCSLKLIPNPLASRTQRTVTSVSSGVPLCNRKKLNFKVKAFFFNPTEDPVVKEAIKEPVAFFGGMFAGLLRLDLNDEPLKEWVSKTVEASGISEEEIEARGLKAEEEAPQQIEIE